MSRGHFKCSFGLVWFSSLVFICNMLISYYLITVILVRYMVNGQTKPNKRQRRYLLFTSSTQYGAFATISVPLHPETTVSLAWFFEANYYNVDNATYFEPLLGDITVSSRDREKRSFNTPDAFLTRKSAYIYIEDMLEKHGYTGHPCLLRAICENSSSEYHHNGVLGDLMHFLLTPSKSMAEDGLEDDYYEAEFLGLEDQCEEYEEDCPHNPLDQISVSFEYLT